MRDLFPAFAQPVRAAKVHRNARQHITEPTRDLEARIALKEQLFAIGHLAAPFGAREAIWLVSFRLLTARTINRLFLVAVSVTGKTARQPR